MNGAKPDKDKESLVSVIVPTRNSSRTLEACLASVRNQTYPNMELIVVDRDSSDDSKEIARRYADIVSNFGDERCAQRNEGVRLSSGQYLFVIDSDMVVTPRVVAACVSAMRQPGIGSVSVPEESFGEGFWSACKRLERSFYVGVPWIEAARFFRKDFFLEIGGYDEELVSGEDWELSQRMETKGSVAGIKEFIKHDEGRSCLFSTLRKKFYYATRFAKYAGKTTHKETFKKQTGIFSRYGLFFAQPKRLFAEPLVGFGMLFMKTMEFFVGGAGYCVGKLGRRASG